MTNCASASILESEPERQNWLKNTSRPLVFTNGCFDILHRGHVSYLQQAAMLGSSLIVALNSDASVRRLGKDQSRPINPLEDRMAVIASLACVDAVCSFDQDTPLVLIQQCMPNHLVKGGDWPIDEIVGCPDVRSWGGRCHSLAFQFERSTTALIESIRAETPDTNKGA